MVTLFSYRRGNSLVHKAPALLKIILLIVICIFTFKGGSYNSIVEILSLPIILRTGTCLLISLILFMASKSNFEIIKQISFVLVLGIAVIILKTFRLPCFLSSNELQDKFIIQSFSFLYFDLNGLASGILYTVRFFITTLFANIVFETTSILEINEALESIQNVIAKIFPPIQKLKLALVLSLAINFIPQIFTTWNNIHIASIARSGKEKKSLSITIYTVSQELQALFSCLLFQAETKRKAILNRSC